MITVDIVFIVLLLLFFIAGWRKGLVVAFGQLLGAIIGFAIARSASAWLANILSQWIHVSSGWLHIIAFVIIFMIVDRLFGLVIGLINKLVKILSIIPFLSTINGLLGGILGFIEGILIIGASIYLIKSLHLTPTLLAWVTQSHLAPFMEQIFYKGLGFMLFL